MNVTGPMKSIIQRRKNQQLVDAHKYSQTGHQWKMTSALATHNKKYGALGEIYGEDKFEEIARFVNQ